MSDEPKLILKRSPLADAGFEDYRVPSGDKVVGRIYCDKRSRSGREWFWGLAYGYHRGLHSHGYVATREAAMAAFRKCWDEAAN
jgi:hypothetical protein